MARRPGNINRLLAGAQQQMRAVPRSQLAHEAERCLVFACLAVEKSQMKPRDVLRHSHSTGVTYMYVPSRSLSVTNWLRLPKLTLLATMDVPW